MEEVAAKVSESALLKARPKVRKVEAKVNGCNAQHAIIYVIYRIIPHYTVTPYPHHTETRLGPKSCCLGHSTIEYILKQYHGTLTALK